MSEKSGFKKFLGQFAEKEFYVELAQTAIREIIRAVILALAGALTCHIQRRFQGGTVEYTVPNTVPNNSNSFNAASRAFGAEERRPYTPSYMPSSPSSSNTFPGFGSR